MKRFTAILFSFMLVVSAFADIHVKGRVIDADGSEPLIGVSILAKGTTIGTVTDFEGNFELTVPDKTTLQISYIGYKTIEIRAVEKMNVIMEADAIGLQEVVSLGYSAVKKAELSSAVVTVDAETLTDVTSSDIGNMLQGKVAGLTVTNASGQPGEAAQIRIRGTGSISAGADPVYVVDGVMG
ncbi:MAG: carboxypeptidase-like regulatory domain-containing protein, partial [Paludibacteraceae bacterium]|nr:carboxypeptidase-like regulatory domain-containing protein [Paludibacteraceae bacterium]